MPSTTPETVATEAHSLPVGEILAALRTEAEQGLTGDEAGQRLGRDGPNTLAEAAAVPGWRRFLGQFRSVLVLLLLFAALVSVGLWLLEGDSALPFEAIAIFAIVVLNAVMGHVQEGRAAEAVAALRGLSAAQATVIRDGTRQGTPAAGLVAGDIILVEEGDTVPADARLIEVVSLRMAEAALTGESQPVDKDLAPVAAAAPLAERHCMIFSGTAASSGRGRAIVIATGARSQLGRIAGMLEAAPEETTPLQRELDRIGRLLGAIVIVIAIAMIGTILLLQDLHGLAAILDVLILGVALAVAAVPEGLPAIVTAVLSLGVQRMARRNAIVRKLAAVETLGSAQVIASDKTGTLTRNEMTVRAVVTAGGRVAVSGSGYAAEGEMRRADGGPVAGDLRVELLRLLTAGERANNAALRASDGRWIVQGDPTEGALIVAARKAGLEREALDARFSRIGELPFSSERKLMSTVQTDAEAQDGHVLLTKGAPDVLLLRCSQEGVGGGTRVLTQARRAEILASNDALAGEALRTLGIACRTLPEAAALDEGLEQDLVFLGLVGMIDPPRDEAKQAILRAKGAGIRPIIITGDHPATAAVIAAELGVADDGRTLSGTELEAMTDAALNAAVRDVSVFARVDPAHKLRIVRALQHNGLVVAMTGDGVNDAPALKTADIGIAMGLTGTDVSKRAADIVLADDNFASIVAAVEEGRAIYANIRKFLRYLLSSNIGEVMTMFFGVLFADAIGLTAANGGGLALPLLATQILWINLVTDGAPALALGVEPAEPGAMSAPPRPAAEGVITPGMWVDIVLIGLVMATGTLLVLDASLPGGLIAGEGSLAHARTMAFTTLMLFQIFNVFNARSSRRSAFRGLFTNRWLWGAVGLSLVLQVCVVHVPVLQQAFSTTALGAGDWLVCLATASSVLWLREASKVLVRARHR